MKIRTAAQDADTGELRRQIQVASDAVSKALADLDGALATGTGQPWSMPYPAHLLPDLVADLSDAYMRLESAARKLGEMEGADIEARELVADLERGRPG